MTDPSVPAGDPPGTGTPAGGPQANTGDPGPDRGDETALGDPGKRALDAERKARREAERRLRDAESRVAELEVAELRRQVAAERNLTPAQAARLRGSTRDEIEADADDLLAAFAAPPGAAGTGDRRPPSNRPTADLKGGGDPTRSVDNPAEVADRILGRGV